MRDRWVLLLDCGHAAPAQEPASRIEICAACERKVRLRVPRHIPAIRVLWITDARAMPIVACRSCMAWWKAGVDLRLTTEIFGDGTQIKCSACGADADLAAMLRELEES